MIGSRLLNSMAVPGLRLTIGRATGGGMDCRDGLVRKRTAAALEGDFKKAELAPRWRQETPMTRHRIAKRLMMRSASSI